MSCSPLSDLINPDTSQVWTRGCVFRNTRDQFGVFSNMKAGMPIRYGGMFWRSSEALYQAARFQNNPILWKAINSQDNAFLAKQKAYEFIDMTRDDWHEIKIDVMASVLTLKYWAWSYKLWPLTKEYDHLIIEESKRDNFWGACPTERFHLIGANVLGQLWTLVLKRGRSAQSNDVREDLLPKMHRTLDDVLKGI